ncbi:MAG: hypothetical protein COC00_013115 [Rhizobiales bacterium]|nr:hypothetical protein [Hyphomicrobiales bacterium]
MMKFSKLKQYMAAIPIVYAATFSSNIHALASGNEIQFEGEIDAAAMSFCTVIVNESFVDMAVSDPLFPTEMQGTTAFDGLSVETNDTGMSILPAIITESYPSQNAGTVQPSLTLNGNSGNQILSNGINEFEIGMTLSNSGSGSLAAGTYNVFTDFTCTTASLSELGGSGGVEIIGGRSGTES